MLTYWRWYTNNVGDNGGTDKWIVSVTDNGSNWVDLENTSSSDLSWSKQRFILSNFIDLGPNITFRLVVEDVLYSGDAGSGGSLVEAGLDDFKLEYLGAGSGILGDVNNDEQVNVLDFIPASSPLCSLIISNLHFFFSIHFEYILLSISAQSWLSVPPAPA